MSKWIVDIHGEIEGDYDLIKKYEEPKTGHWIYPYETTTLVSICSECGTHGRGNFCPNCGAKMVESEDEG